MLIWTRHVTNDDSPYPEDRRYSWTCAEFELSITKEGDGKYWLRHRGNPLGMGPRLMDAKIAGQRFVDGKLGVPPEESI